MDSPKKAPKLGSLAMEDGTGKLEVGLQRLCLEKPEQEVTVIIKVTEDGYVPPGVKVRALISPRLLTAQTTGQGVQQMLRDPRIVSIAGAETLPLIAPRPGDEPAKT